MVSIVVLFLVSAYFCKSTTDDWINPRVLCFFYWMLFIFGSLLCLKGKYIWNTNGVIWMYFACLSFMIGGYFSDYLFKRSKNSKITGITELSKISWNIIILITVIGVIRSLIEVTSNGFHINMLFDINSLIDVNTNMAELRYSGDKTSKNSLLQILAIFTYAAPLCGGYAYLYAKSKKEKLISLFTFVPILISLLVTNAKAGVLACIFMWISSFMVSFIQKNKKMKRIKIKSIIKIFIIIIFFSMLLVFSMMLRIGELDLKILKVVFDKFFVYGFGEISAFDYWISSGKHLFEYGLGSNTFMAVFKTLGVIQREQGVYSDILIFSNGMLTNVYTIFRGIIMDFGVYGGILFMWISGVIAGFTFNKIKFSKRRKNVVSITLMSAIYFTILYSFIISPWIYSSYILAFLVFLGYLIIC